MRLAPYSEGSGAVVSGNLETHSKRRLVVNKTSNGDSPVLHASVHVQEKL